MSHIKLKSIIIVVVIVVVVISGLVYFWQQKSNPTTTNESNVLDARQPSASVELPTKNYKTSLELMKELVVKNYGNPVIKNYKIFAEIKSPYSSKSVVLFGSDPEKDPEQCCLSPKGIFINNRGILGKEYEFVRGDWNHLSLENPKWIDDNTVSYYYVISDESGNYLTKKIIKAD